MQSFGFFNIWLFDGIKVVLNKKINDKTEVNDATKLSPNANEN